MISLPAFPAQEHPCRSPARATCHVIQITNNAARDHPLAIASARPPPPSPAPAALPLL